MTSLSSTLSPAPHVSSEWRKRKCSQGRFNYPRLFPVGRRQGCGWGSLSKNSGQQYHGLPVTESSPGEKAERTRGGDKLPVWLRLWTGNAGSRQALWPRAAGPLKQKGHHHTVKVNKRGSGTSTHQHAGLGASQFTGIENWVTGNDLKAAGAGKGATRSLAGWALVYSKAM